MASAERNIIALEKQYWDAVQQRDGRTVEKLTDDGCIVVDGNGIREVDRRTLVDALEHATYELQGVEFDDTQAHVKMLGRNVAVVSYPVREQMVTDGKAATLDAFDASVWVRRDDGWVCAIHTETPAAAPFTGVQAANGR